jgi:hypothetical protein
LEFLTPVAFEVTAESAMLIAEIDFVFLPVIQSNSVVPAFSPTRRP